nr:unnamed protein product [Digitaria exilis]
MPTPDSYSILIIDFHIDLHATPPPLPLQQRFNSTTLPATSSAPRRPSNQAVQRRVVQSRFTSTTLLSLVPTELATAAAALDLALMELATAARLCSRV